jgi:RDD family
VATPHAVPFARMDPWPLPSTRRRLLAAACDLGTIFAICTPLLIFSFQNVQENLDGWKATCAERVGAAAQATCLSDAHSSEYSTFAVVILLLVGLVGVAYFALQQSRPRRATVGEHLAGVRVVRDWPRHPITRPTFQPCWLRYVIGLGACVPPAAVALELWLDTRVGLTLLAILGIPALVFSRALIRGLRPAPDSGAMFWDRWTNTLVVATASSSSGDDHASSAIATTTTPAPSDGDGDTLA